VNQASLFELPPPPEPKAAATSRPRRRSDGPHLRAVVERQSRPPRPRLPLGVVEQVRLSLRRGSRLAFALGVLLGGFVPIATYVIAHTELQLQRPLYLQPAAAFVAGGLLFSAVTMYNWGKLAFMQRAKALGFVVLLEGTMVTAQTPWLALTALAYLATINGVATACNLARGEG
jgi:hypothetical protein